MKRSTIIAALLVLILGVLVFGVVFLSNPDLFAESKESDGTVQIQTNRAKIPVLSGTVEHTYDVPAQVISGQPELYWKTVTFEASGAGKAAPTISKGTDFEIGSTLAIAGGEKLCAVFPGKLLWYEADSALDTLTMTFLDYSALYIPANISAERLNEINYHTPVRVSTSSGTMEGQIERIDYEILNGQVGVDVSLPDGAKILPGTVVTVTFITEITEASMYIPSEAVFHETTGDAYTTVEGENAELVKVPITTGEVFCMEESGVIFEYTEVLSGLKPGELLTVEFLGDLPADVERLIENE